MMSQFIRTSLLIKTIVLIVLVSGISHYAKGQARESQELLKIINEPDDDDTAYVSDEDYPDDASQASKNLRKRSHSFFADIGTAQLKRTDSNYRIGSGITIALGGQYILPIKTHSKYNRLSCAIGVELRNANCTFMGEDMWGITRDRFHSWYVGVPVMFQLVNTRHLIGDENDVHIYAQAGLSCGIRASVYEYYDATGITVNVSKYYSAVLLQPFVSAGVSYTSNKNTYLIGPFYGGSIGNITSRRGVSESIHSFGIRLTAMMFR